MAEIDPELDAAIARYHAAEAASTDQFYAAISACLKGDITGVHRAYSPEDKNKLMCQLWFEGLDKWGQAWAIREYEIRFAKVDAK